MIPRLSPRVSLVAAICAVLAVPYYAMTGQVAWVGFMLTLAALNAVCARS